MNMNVLDYVFFRFYSYFKKRKNEDLPMLNTLMIIFFCEVALLLAIYHFLDIFIELDFIQDLFQENRDNKVLICILFSIIGMSLNYIYFSRKRESNYYSGLKQKYYRDKYRLPIWIMFSFPALAILIPTIINGTVKGTLRFPLFERLF